MGEMTRAIRCDPDGLKTAEVKDGHLIIREKHHGETHVKIVALVELGLSVGAQARATATAAKANTMTGSKLLCPDRLPYLPQCSRFASFQDAPSR